MRKKRDIIINVIERDKNNVRLLSAFFAKKYNEINYENRKKKEIHDM